MENDRSSAKLPSVHDFLMAAPEHQVKRLQIASRAILAGEWQEAIFTLRNAILEEQERMHPQLTKTGRYWHSELREFVDQMETEHGAVSGMS